MKKIDERNERIRRRRDEDEDEDEGRNGKESDISSGNEERGGNT